MSDIAIVQASFGDPGEAALVARKLLEERLAACTSLVPVTRASRVSAVPSWRYGAVRPRPSSEGTLKPR